MSKPIFPVPLRIMHACMAFHDFHAGDTLQPLPGIVLRTAPLNHPNGATAYRIDYAGRSICYVTDTEHREGELDNNIIELIRGSQLVIYDSTYTEEEYPRYRGWGHSTWNEGVKLCEAAGAGHADRVPPRPRSQRCRPRPHRGRAWPGLARLAGSARGPGAAPLSACAQAPDGQTALAIGLVAVRPGPSPRDGAGDVAGREAARLFHPASTRRSASCRAATRRSMRALTLGPRRFSTSWRRSRPGSHIFLR